MSKINYFDKNRRLPIGHKVRFDATLAERLIQDGYPPEYGRTDVVWRILGYRTQTDAYGYDFRSICLADERDEDFWLWLRDSYWTTLIEVPLSLVEKEQVRRQAEPWVRRRDMNLRSVFQPEPRQPASRSPSGLTKK